MAHMAPVVDSSYADPEPDARAKRLFLACFFSIFATSSAFIVRAFVIGDWAREFGLTNAQQGAIFPGAALFPFAISIVLFSLFIDRLGYGKTMAFAVVGHLVGTTVTILASKASSHDVAYQMLYFGTFITSLANGAIEAVANPVTATLFPRKKTHYLNILHAGWPGGLVGIGVVTLLMGSNFSWEWKVGLVYIPTVLYGLLLLGQRFPVQERVAAGVSYTDMMREFGAASAFILAWFLTMATLTVVAVLLPGLSQGDSWNAINTYAPPVVALVSAVLFFAIYKSFGRPLFVFMLLIMLLLATTELGVDGWVTDLMTPAFGKYAGWILVYTSTIMFFLRFCAGPIVHRLSPLGLLAAGAAIAAIALFTLSKVGNSIPLVILAATLYGMGKSFFWPTTLGVVSEQFPRGGALTLSAMGGMGMIAVGVLGGPFLGALLDNRIDDHLRNQAPAIHQVVVGPQVTNYGMTYNNLDPARTAALPADQLAPAIHQVVVGPQVTNYGMTYNNLDPARTAALPADQLAQVDQIKGQTKQGALATIAILPVIMLICYLSLLAYFKSKGGYQVQHISGEKAAGGIQAPVA